MGIVKEYFCPGHGSFESDEPRCPKGCTVGVEREFRTPPMYSTGRVGKTDALVGSQLEAMGHSNVRRSYEGESARIVSPQDRMRMEHAEAIRQRYPKNWGQLPSAKQGGAEAVVKQYHAEPTQGIDKEALTAAKPTYQYIRDPQNLKVDVTKAA